MEVVHLILGKANPERMNGVNKVVHALASNQHAAGIKTSVWGLAKDLEHNYPPRSYQTELFKRTWNPFTLSPEFKKAIQSKAETETVFHLHGGFLPAMSSASSLLKKARIPFVFTPHGSYNLIAMQKSGFRKGIYKLFFEKPLVRKAAAIQVLGSSEQSGLQQWYRNQKTTVIPYGFDVEDADEIKGVAAQINALPERPFRIGFCGRLDIYTKGLDVLLDGFAQTLTHYPDCELHLIGDSPERAELLQHALALKIKDAVIFHGAKFGEEKMNLLRACHVFVHPSRNEGLPTAVLEAASIGIPLIVTEATNLGKAVAESKAGYVMDGTSTIFMEHALRFMYQATEGKDAYKSMGDNARNMVLTRFSWNHLIPRYEALYTQVLKERKRK